MEGIAKQLMKLAVAEPPPVNREQEALRLALERRDEAGVVAGIRRCGDVLRKHGKAPLQELLGYLVEEGFGVDAIEACVTQGADLRHVDAAGQTYLHRAILADRLARSPFQLLGEKRHPIPHATFVCLVRHGGRFLLESGDAQGITPLMMAFGDGNRELEAWLLDEGVPVDAFDKAGNTVLLQHLQRGDRDAVARLLELGADPWVTARPDLQNALTLAAARLDRDMLRVLLDHGLPITGSDGKGCTVLHRVAALPRGTHGVADMARTLLDMGVPLDAVDDDGATALIEAVAAGHLDMVKLLLQRGADATVACGPSLANQTALHFAAVVPKPEGDRARSDIEEEREAALRGELVDLLIDAGAKVDARDAHACTPLLYAVDARCRPAYLALQNAYFARGIAVGERELMLMAERAVMPVAPQIAFRRLGAECVRLRNRVADLEAGHGRWLGEREKLQARVRALQQNLSSSDLECGRLAAELAEAVEQASRLSQRVIELEGVQVHPSRQPGQGGHGGQGGCEGV